MGTNTRQHSNLQFEKLSNQIVEWQAVHVADGSTGLSAVSGRGYFIDTTSGAQTVTLPASPVIGDTIMIVDYASTFATNNVTVNPNGNKIEADSSNGTLQTNDQTHTLVFTDSTQGWKIVNQDTASSIQARYIAATGGTVTTSTDFKIHTFTGDGCFVVSCAGNPSGSTTVDYLVVAGGGAGHYDNGGGGGAGGFRYSADTFPVACVPAEPLKGPAALTLPAATYPVTVGGGAAGTPFACTPAVVNNGSNSVFSTITSAGGGGGAGCGPNNPAPSGRNAGKAGGSGGGAGQWSNPDNPGAGGTGNTPPVSPAQGTNGGATGSPNPNKGGAGGGGATTAGSDAPSNDNGGNGGDGGGLPNAFGCNGVPCSGFRFYAGGGGGGNAQPGSGTGGTAGKGGAGAGGSSGGAGTAGTANTGGGAGGGGQAAHGASGGKGIVVLRYKFQN